MGLGSSGTATEERRLEVREWEMERKSRDSDTSRGFTGCCSGHGRPSLKRKIFFTNIFHKYFFKHVLPELGVVLHELL